VKVSRHRLGEAAALRDAALQILAEIGQDTIIADADRVNPTGSWGRKPPNRLNIKLLAGPVKALKLAIEVMPTSA
jgi:hypothetical protein